MAAALVNVFERLIISACKKPLGKFPCVVSRTPTVSSRNLRTQSTWKGAQIQPKVQEISPIPDTEGKILFKEIAARVNKQILEKNYGRLFAVIHIFGKQFKITDEDLIVLEGAWDPKAGDRIRLEKVLLVGGTDFTLVGTPLLPADLVHVEATVVESTFSHTKTLFRKKRRKQYMRINFFRLPYTTLRINSIRLSGKVDERKDVEGLEGRVF